MATRRVTRETLRRSRVVAISVDRSNTIENQWALLDVCKNKNNTNRFVFSPLIRIMNDVHSTGVSVVDDTRVTAHRPSSNIFVQCHTPFYQHRTGQRRSRSRRHASVTDRFHYNINQSGRQLFPFVRFDIPNNR